MRSALQGKDQETKRPAIGVEYRRYRPRVRVYIYIYISPLVVAPFNGHPSAVAVRLPIGPERGKTCVRERPLTNSCRHCRRHRRSSVILYIIMCRVFFFTDALAALTGPARNVRLFGYNDDDDDDVK